jgi:glycosyltransferase involved in cell wall biosynthesis
MSRLNQEQKRARDLVPFCRGLDAAGLDYHLTVVGDGDEFDFLSNELTESVQSGRVEMTGMLAFPDAMAHFVDKDVFVLFSAYEGMPLVLLHALAEGAVPVVTNLQSGVSELLDDGVNGLLFPVGRPETAAELVCELDHNRTRLAKLREAARKLGEKNSIRITMVEFEKRLRMILSGTVPHSLWKTCSAPKVLGDTWRARLLYKLPAPVLKMLGSGK